MNLDTALIELKNPPRISVPHLIVESGVFLIISCVLVMLVE